MLNLPPDLLKTFTQLSRHSDLTAGMNGVPAFERIEVQRAIDILDAIPETHDFLEQARARGMKIMPADLSAAGYVAVYDWSENKIFYDAKAINATIESFGGDPGAPFSFATLLADITSHELKHFDQHHRVSFGELLPRDEKNRLTRDVLMADRVIEADAHAFQDFMCKDLDRVIEALGKGLTPDDIRAQLNTQPRPLEDKAAYITTFQKHLTDLTGYDYQAILATRDKVFFTPDQQPPGASPPMQQSIGRLREVLGQTNFFDGMTDRQFARMVLTGIDDNARATSWAIDAYHHAGRRGHTMTGDRHTIHLHKLRDRALASVNHYVRNLKPGT